MCRRGYSKKGVLFCVSEQVLIRALSAEFSFCRESKRCGIAHALSSTHTKCGNLGQNCVAPNAHSTGVTVPCDRLCVSRTLGRWNRRFHRHTSIQRYRTFAGVMRGICADATGLYGGFCVFRESSRLACKYTRAYLPSVVTGKLYNAEFLCCAVMPVHIRARKICAFIWADYALGGENL